MATTPSVLRFLTESVGVYLTTDRIVHITGDDARSWLNGQITNDVRELADDDARYALALTAKGRIVTDLWALPEADGMAMVLPDAQFDAALERFDKHIIMEDVELETDRDHVVVTVQGPRAGEVIDAASAAVRKYACERLGTVGFDCWVPRDAVGPTLEALTQRAEAVAGGRLDDATWADALVALGVPRLRHDFGESAYPQEAGLARAMSFSKGCYLGQEVVYMLEKRGQLARRAVLLTSAAEGAPSVGAPVHDAEGKRIGELTSVSSLSDGVFAIAYVKRAFAEPEQTVWLAGSPWQVRRVLGAA